MEERTHAGRSSPKGRIGRGAGFHGRVAPLAALLASVVVGFACPAEDNPLRREGTPPAVIPAKEAGPTASPSSEIPASLAGLFHYGKTGLVRIVVEKSII